MKKTLNGPQQESFSQEDRMKKLLSLAAVAEAAIGVALIVMPSLVGRLLLGTELTDVSIPIARVTGIALIGLGVACWPNWTAVCGMFDLRRACHGVPSLSRSCRRLHRNPFMAGCCPPRSSDAASRAGLVQAAREQTSLTGQIGCCLVGHFVSEFCTRHACHHSCRGSRVDCSFPQPLP